MSKSQLPGQIVKYATELSDASDRYSIQASQGYDVEWSKGMAMGMTLALDFLHTWTNGEYGTALKPRKEAS